MLAKNTDSVDIEQYQARESSAYHYRPTWPMKHGILSSFILLRLNACFDQ